MLGLRFDRLVHAALAGGGLTLSACPGGGQDTDTDTDTDGTDSDPTTSVEPTTGPPPPPPPPADITPPALVAVEFLDPQILRLSFTEAIASVDEVNPKRFRLSIGRFYENAYYGYSRTLYNDPDDFNHNLYCAEECYYGSCYEQCYYGPTLEVDILDLLTDAYDPAKIVLLLEQPVTPSLCQLVTNISGSGTGGLLIHYADGGASQITDTAGLPLPGTGATWVKIANQNYYTIDNQKFPEQNPFLPIPCPF
ncbi:MAG TPA: hypothetical protein VGB85_22180 [Nannocystis sp.]|jgi:hypothetical protein